MTDSDDPDPATDATARTPAQQKKLSEGKRSVTFEGEGPLVSNATQQQQKNAANANHKVKDVKTSKPAAQKVDVSSPRTN